MHYNISTIRKFISDQKGVALLMAIGSVALMLAAVMQANIDAKYAIEATAVTKERHELTYNAMSGIIIAQAILIKDISDNPKGYDALCEDWGRQDKINEVLAALPPGAGKPTKLVISDEIGKIQVNALVMDAKSGKVNSAQDLLWDRAIRDIVSAPTYESDSDILNETRSIIDCIIDWIDYNDELHGINSVESDYYEGLDTPYKSRNNYFTNINELLLVKGMSNQLFNAVGIPNYVTVYGEAAGKDKVSYPGQININTADTGVLRLLIKEGDEDYLPDVLEFRDERNDDGGCMNDLSSIGAYKSAVGNIFYNDLITTRSHLFRVDSTAKIKQTTKTVTAILLRKQDAKTKRWTCELISYKDTR
ncbi:general secretion pathway protein K [Candidatus Magnetomorum sp. HK-1]|nr:general secretion pathway protein K [Candidatus Magnetomorum sp. HK-1]